MNYKQENITGESWVRSNRVMIENPLNGVPVITFAEEKVANIGAEAIKTKFGQVSEQLVDPATTFNIIDPITGINTGTTSTYGNVYVLLHSLYLHLAQKRDIEQ